MADEYDVAVVGGGVAGIAAATQLASAGLRTVILDKRPYLGGRASSWVDSRTGRVFDVCQHVTLGCCTEFEGLLSRLNLRDNLTYLDEVLLQDAGGKRAALRAWPLPVPFHLAPSLLRVPWLTFGDRTAAARLLSDVRRFADDPPLAARLDFETWARRSGATPGLMRGLLTPIVVSACNADLSAVSAAVGVSVLDRSLMQSRDGYRIGLFTRPVGEMLTEATRAAIEKAGGSLRSRTTVTGIERVRSRTYRIAIRPSGNMTASACVVAVPWDVQTRLLPLQALTPAMERATRLLTPGTIVATHHWFAGPLDCPEALGLVGRNVHWLFKKPAAFHNDDCGSYVTTVTSNAHYLGSLGASEILGIAEDDIRAALGCRALPPIIHARAFVERKATFIPAPGSETLRPSCATSWPDLAVAGEWTDTGWPSTMEGAARSGAAAAAVILHSGL